MTRIIDLFFKTYFFDFTKDSNCAVSFSTHSIIARSLSAVEDSSSLFNASAINDPKYNKYKCK